MYVLEQFLKISSGFGVQLSGRCLYIYIYPEGSKYFLRRYDWTLLAATSVPPSKRRYDWSPNGYMGVVLYSVAGHKAEKPLPSLKPVSIRGFRTAPIYVIIICFNL